MNNFVVYKGLPASGKSTRAKDYLARNPTAIRVNNDALSWMLSDVLYTPSNRAIIKEIVGKVIELAFSESRDILIDNTNLQAELIPHYREIVHKHNLHNENKYEFVVVDLTDVSLETCIVRDAAREHPVGEDIIRTMYEALMK